MPITVVAWTIVAAAALFFLPFAVGWIGEIVARLIRSPAGYGNVGGHILRHAVLPWNFRLRSDIRALARSKMDAEMPSLSSNIAKAVALRPADILEITPWATANRQMLARVLRRAIFRHTLVLAVGLAAASIALR